MTEPDLAPASESADPRIATVLSSLDVLDDLPVAEHVAVFDAAHDALRGALDTAGDAPVAAPPQP